LLGELLDLPSSERAGRLEGLHEEDAALAAKLALLAAANEQANGACFLTGVADGAAVAAAGQTPTAVGQRVGAYLLEAHLGQGGAGSIWRARRADGRFEGYVAIKLLHLSLLGHAGAQRFRREGAILARLAHPHIARLLDAGISDSGQPYLVLELIEGERIDRYCDTNRLPVEQRLALFADVVSAVSHAHSHLVIHRDIKPANILVGKAGNVKLLDFGIAKLIEDEAETGEMTQITQAGSWVLTPEYAAPEQLLGEAVTTATDVYALGVLLYQLLTGRHPTAPSRACVADLMRATLEADPLPLANAWGPGAAALAGAASQRSTTPSSLVRQLRGDLENIVARALRKEPIERYGTADALAEDLRRRLAHEPVSARPDSLAYRGAKFLRRRRAVVVAGALTSAAVVAGLLGTMVQAHRAEQEARQAQMERDSALHDLAFANGAHDLLAFLVSQGNGKPMTASELLARAGQSVERQFVDDPLTRGRLQLMLGVQYGDVLEYEKSKAVLAKARASALAARDTALLTNVDCMLAATLGDQGQPERAFALFDSAIRRSQFEAHPDRTVLAACLHMRADLNARMGRPRAMLADAQAALNYLGTPRPDLRVKADSLRIVVAEAYGRLGETAKAIAAYESSLADIAGLGLQQTVRSAVRFSNFSRMLYVAGQIRRAQEMAARGLELSRGIAADSGMIAVVESNDARALIDLGRFGDAKPLIEHALASSIQRKDERLAGTIALYGAPAWCATGDLGRCASLLAMAREKLRVTLPPRHPNSGLLDLADAQLSLARKQPSQAREQLLRAVAAFDAAMEASLLGIRAIALLARTDLESGDLPAAARYATMALARALGASKGFASTEWLGIALVSQAVVQQAQGNKDGARGTIRQAIAQLEGSVGVQVPASREARAILRGLGGD
jgi:serine/threonine-protein kinase